MTPFDGPRTPRSKSGAEEQDLAERPHHAAAPQKVGIPSRPCQCSGEAEGNERLTALRCSRGAPTRKVPLAQRAGLDVLVAEHVRIDRECGMNAHLKVPCLAAGMVAGADSIDDMDLLRHGAMPVLFGDSMQKRVYGHKKQGAAFGHTKIQGKACWCGG